MLETNRLYVFVVVVQFRGLTHLGREKMVSLRLFFCFAFADTTLSHRPTGNHHRL